MPERRKPGTAQARPHCEPGFVTTQQWCILLTEMLRTICNSVHCTAFAGTRCSTAMPGVRWQQITFDMPKQW